MARYHFVVCGPDHTHDDPDGMQLPTHDAAKDHGNRIVRELKMAAIVRERRLGHTR
ncbi:MAG TPA: hypothetical protein VF772_21120 [Terriglobales bacterium]